MKKSILFFAALLTAFACQSPQQDTTAQQTTAAEAVPVTDLTQATAYGEEISAAEAKSMEEAFRLLEGKDSVYTTLRATALESCTKKGCWMKVDLGQEESMRVTFKDYGFFVPKNLSGEPVVMQGVLKKAVSSVDELRHYAEDAGKSAAEIAAIQQADTAYTFEATGVLIWPRQQ